MTHSTRLAAPNEQRQQDAQRRSEELSGHILPLRADGKSLREIAATLSQAGIPTANGGSWGPKQVLDILHRLEQPTAPVHESRDPLAALHVQSPTTQTVPGDPLAALPVSADPLAL
ncbi:recombinase family protein [Vannielia sp. SX4]|uniref:recombinase family protein n=1 Tax=Vannielia sp. SX4 TaxID=3463852 RepID=UPI004058D518